MSEPTFQLPPTSRWMKFLWLLVGLVALALVGLATRAFSFWFPNVLAQTPGMILFFPASLASLWLAWRPRLNLVEFATVGLILVLAFAIWNGIMLYGLDQSQVRAAIWSNAIHWLLYVSVATVASRYVQWFSAIGIWKLRSDASNNEVSAPLSIQKLFGLICLVAVGVTIVQANWPTNRPVTTMWFQIIPSQWRSNASAVVGGLLLPLYWFAIASILRWKSFRLAGLILCLPILAWVRWGSGQLYWPLYIPVYGTDAMQSELELSLPNTPLETTSPLDYGPGQSGNVLLDACVQLTLTLLALACLHRAGYRCGPTQIRRPS
jgi:hypothetical protein